MFKEVVRLYHATVQFLQRLTKNSPMKVVDELKL
jgi:hypothetical protein